MDLSSSPDSLLDSSLQVECFAPIIWRQTGNGEAGPISGVVLHERRRSTRSPQWDFGGSLVPLSTNALFSSMGGHCEFVLRRTRPCLSIPDRADSTREKFRLTRLPRPLQQFVDIACASGETGQESEHGNKDTPGHDEDRRAHKSTHKPPRRSARRQPRQSVVSVASPCLFSPTLSAELEDR
jgi:hypothetical protein